GVERRFGGPDRGRPPRPVTALAPPHRLIVDTRPTEQAHLVVGPRALPCADEDRYTLSVLNQVLGGGMSSRLFQEIREKRGLVYSVYSYRTAYIESGVLAVYAGTAPARAHEVLELIHAELDRLATGEITDRELAVAKGHIKGSQGLSQDDSGGRMQRVGPI